MAADLATTNGHDLTDTEARTKAREMWRATAADGQPMTGAELGRAFGKTDRWGRKQIEAARSGHRPAHGPPGRPRRMAPGRRNAQPQSDGTAGTPNRSVGAPVDRDAGHASPSTVVTPDMTPAGPQTTDGTDPRAAAAAPGGSWLDSVIILAVALVAAAASYGHMLEVAVWAGEPMWIARAFPLTVDGLVLAALRRGRQGRWWLGLGIAVSIAANMLARYPDLAATAGPVVSAWPPIALFGTHRLLHARRTGR
jgi:hypothetical protein